VRQEILGRDCVRDELSIGIAGARALEENLIQFTLTDPKLIHAHVIVQLPTQALQLSIVQLKKAMLARYVPRWILRCSAALASANEHLGSPQVPPAQLDRQEELLAQVGLEKFLALLDGSQSLEAPLPGYPEVHTVRAAAVVHEAELGEAAPAREDVHLDGQNRLLQVLLLEAPALFQFVNAELGDFASDRHYGVPAIKTG